MGELRDSPCTRREVVRGLTRIAKLGGGLTALPAAVTGCVTDTGRGYQAPGGAPHQPGIIDRPPAAVLMAAYDVIVGDRSNLGALLSQLSALIGESPAAGL